MFKIGQIIKRKNDKLDDDWWLENFDGSKASFKVIEIDEYQTAKIKNRYGNLMGPNPTSMELYDKYDNLIKRMIDG